MLSGPIFRLGAEASLGSRCIVLLVCFTALCLDWPSDPFLPIWLFVGGEIIATLVSIVYYHIVPWCRLAHEYGTRARFDRS